MFIIISGVWIRLHVYYLLNVIKSTLQMQRIKILLKFVKTKRLIVRTSRYYQNNVIVIVVLFFFTFCSTFTCDQLRNCGTRCPIFSSLNLSVMYSDMILEFRYFYFCLLS